MTEYPNPYQLDVAKFHRAYGLPDLLDAPVNTIPEDRRELRLSLIKEEGIDELGRAVAEEDDIAILDALLDTAYVALGALVEMGFVLDGKEFAEFETINQAPSKEGLIAFSSNVQNLIHDEYKHLENKRDLDTKSLYAITSYALSIMGMTGYKPRAFFEEVQRSNMSKLGADGKPIRSRGQEIDGAPLGKVLKGPNFSAPDLKKILERQEK